MILEEPLFVRRGYLDRLHRRVECCVKVPLMLTFRRCFRPVGCRRVIRLRCSSIAYS